MVECMVISPNNGHICKIIFDHYDLTTTQRKLQKRLKEIMLDLKDDENFELEFSWFL